MIDPLWAYNTEKIILAGLAGLYGLAFVFYSPPQTKAKGTFKTIGFCLHILALLGNTFLVYLRIVNSGHLPFTILYESMFAISWCVSFVFLVLSWKPASFGYGRSAAVLSWMAVLVALLIFLFSPNDKTLPHYLSPALNSVYLDLHVIPAFLAYGCFAMAFSAAFTSLTGKDEIKTKRRSLAEFYLWPGLILFTLSLGLGAAGAKLAWGSWWLWQPKWIFSAVTWGIFFLAMSLRHGKGKGKAGFPWLIILGFISMMFTFLGTNAGYHDFL